MQISPIPTAGGKQVEDCVSPLCVALALGRYSRSQRRSNGPETSNRSSRRLESWSRRQQWRRRRRRRRNKWLLAQARPDERWARRTLVELAFGASNSIGSPSRARQPVAGDTSRLVSAGHRAREQVAGRPSQLAPANRSRGPGSNPSSPRRGWMASRERLGQQQVAHPAAHLALAAAANQAAGFVLFKSGPEMRPTPAGAGRWPNRARCVAPPPIRTAKAVARI